jgi:hypothetical protein
VNQATHVDLYLVADMLGLGIDRPPALGEAASPGVRCTMHAPIVGAEIELEARALSQELMLRTA